MARIFLCAHCGRSPYPEIPLRTGRGERMRDVPPVMTFDGGTLAVETDALGFLNFTAYPDERIDVMAELRHPNEVAMEAEQAAYFKNLDAITKARQAPHPNQVAAEQEQAEREKNAAAIAKAVAAPHPQEVANQEEQAAREKAARKEARAAAKDADA